MDTQKIIVLHGFTQDEAVVAMRAVKAALPASAAAMAFATSTPTNLNWRLNDLFEHVGEEHRQFREMNKA
jgi:hypothetical protein